jgi:hypothetical protein
VTTNVTLDEDTRVTDVTTESTAPGEDLVMTVKTKRRKNVTGEDIGLIITVTLTSIARDADHLIVLTLLAVITAAGIIPSTTMKVYLNMIIL